MSDTSLKLFDQLRGQFDAVDLWSLPQLPDGGLDVEADPEPTEDPDQAVYFTVKLPVGDQELEITVSLANERSLGIWYSKDIVKDVGREQIKTFQNFIKGMRSFGLGNLRGVDLYPIPKPRVNIDDLKVNAGVTASTTESLEESVFSKPFGSTKTSIQRLGEFNLRIKHTKAVNENGRFRYIKRLYVENKLGERFMLPTNNLAAGRAMLRHYEQGGSIHDSIGQRIVEMARGVDVARNFLVRVSETNALNEHTNEIIEQVKSYALETAHMLRRLQSQKVYEYFVSSVSEQAPVAASSKWLENLFTQHVLDEELGKLLPEISNIIINAGTQQ